jgi:hypothetical protein
LQIDQSENYTKGHHAKEALRTACFYQMALEQGLGLKTPQESLKNVLYWIFQQTLHAFRPHRPHKADHFFEID